MFAPGAQEPPALPMARKIRAHRARDRGVKREVPEGAPPPRA